MTPIDHDGATDDNGSLTQDDAADALLKSLLPPDDPSKKKRASSADEDDEAPPKPKKEEEDESDTETDEDDESTEETPEDEADDESDGDDEEEPKRKYAEDEGAYVKVPVDGVEHEVPVKDLKRLFGQEAALTKKSQEVADKRKALDAEGARYLAQTQALLTRAHARAEPYSKLNFLALSRDPNITNEELTALQTEAQAAFDEVRFLEAESSTFMNAVQEQQRGSLVETAKKTVQELNDPEKGIKGWSEKLYDDIRSYAIQAGAPKETINNLVDSWAIRLMHKAMMFDRGKAKVTTTKVNKTPKKVVKSSHAPQSAQQTGKAKVNKAMANLKAKGTTDAAAEAFLASFTARPPSDD